MLLVALFACNSHSLNDEGCLHQDLSVWCLHDEATGGPMDVATDDPPCDTQTFAPDASSTRCGDIDVTAASGGFTGTERYFDHASGDLFAVRYWTDVNTYCGGFSYWYGQRVNDCTAECSYDPASTDLPVCE